MPTVIACKKFLRLLPALIFIAMFSAWGFAAHSQDPLDERISADDKLTIKVLEQDELTGAYTVDQDGTLEFPLIAEPIRAAGLTHEELAAKIKQALEKDYFYRATVVIKTFEEGDIEIIAPEAAGGVIYVYGMVRTPGVVIIPEGEKLTVSKAIIRSGGFADFANRKRVQLMRKSPVTGDSETITVNVVNILHRGRLEEDVAVRDGDIIVVPEKFFNF